MRKNCSSPARRVEISLQSASDNGPRTGLCRLSPVNIKGVVVVLPSGELLTTDETSDIISFVVAGVEIKASLGEGEGIGSK